MRYSTHLVLSMTFLFIHQFSFAEDPKYNCEQIKKDLLDAAGMATGGQLAAGVNRSFVDENQVKKNFVPAFNQVFDGQYLKIDDPLYLKAQSLFQRWDRSFNKQFRAKTHAERRAAIKESSQIRNEIEAFEKQNNIFVGYKYNSRQIEVRRVQNLKALQALRDQPAHSLAVYIGAVDMVLVGETRRKLAYESAPLKKDRKIDNLNRSLEIFTIDPAAIAKPTGRKDLSDLSPVMKVSLFESDDVREREWVVRLADDSVYHIWCNSNDVQLSPNSCFDDATPKSSKFCTFYDNIKVHSPNHNSRGIRNEHGVAVPDSTNSGK